MVFNSRGAIHKQSQEAPEVVETVEADIESPEVVEDAVEAPVVEETPTVEPKKSGSRKKSSKSKD